MTDNRQEAQERERNIGLDVEGWMDALMDEGSEGAGAGERESDIPDDNPYAVSGYLSHTTRACVCVRAHACNICTEPGY